MTGAGPGARDGSRGGFVLPIALVVLVVVSMMAATGIYSARNDFRAAATAREVAVALAAADAGANRTVALWDQAVPAVPAPGDSVVLDWQMLPDGSSYRTVVFTPVLESGSGATTPVVIYTTGRGPGLGAARRTVATVLDAPTSPPLCCEASVKVLSRVRVDGEPGPDPIPEVDGTDRVPPGWSGAQCPGPLVDIPGIVTADAGGVEVRGQGDVGGSPPIDQDVTITAADFTDLGPLTYDSLASLADIVLPRNQSLDDVGPLVAAGSCLTGVASNWGSPLDPAGPCGGWAPIVHATGNLRLGGSGQGQGILVVDGSVTLEEGFQFFGMIVTREVLTITDDARIYGGVLVAGGRGGQRRTEVDRGGKILYSSCAVQRVLPDESGASQPSGRTWFEVMG